MRLNKYLAHAGVASRREADRLIQLVTTTINGQIITDPAYQVKENDIVFFDDQRITLPEESIVIMLHKPRGVITTLKDTHGRRTVVDLIPIGERIFPVGRLDKDTTGLILLTNDGELANFLMHPRNRVVRIYEAEIEGRLDQKMIAKMYKGIFIGKGELGRVKVLNQTTDKKRSRITLKLYRGKKREIRRIFDFLKITLFSLKRIQYGICKLNNLPEGQWRKLTPEEIQSLRPQ